MDNTHIGIVDSIDMNNKVQVVDRDMVVDNMVDNDIEDIGIVVCGMAGIDNEGMDVVGVLVVMIVVVVVVVLVAEVVVNVPVLEALEALENMADY